jgi:hypothetical protein
MGKSRCHRARPIDLPLEIDLRARPLLRDGTIIFGDLIGKLAAGLPREFPWRLLARADRRPTLHHNQRVPRAPTLERPGAAEYGVTTMLYLIIKAALSGVVIGAVSEIAKRSPAFGALVVSLPLVSILSMMWLWRDTGDAGRIASLAETTFWFVLPTLPMFLLLPALLRQGIGFWLALAVSCGATIVLYFLTAWLLSKFGINI